LVDEEIFWRFCTVHRESYVMPSARFSDPEVGREG